MFLKKAKQRKRAAPCGGQPSNHGKMMFQLWENVNIRCKYSFTNINRIFDGRDRRTRVEQEAGATIHLTATDIC